MLSCFVTSSLFIEFFPLLLRLYVFPEYFIIDITILYGDLTEHAAIPVFLGAKDILHLVGLNYFDFQ